MRRCLGRSSPLTPMIVGMLALAIVAVPLYAQPEKQAHSERGFGQSYDAAHEMTIRGTIQQVVTKHTPGSPAGMHLLVMGEHGVIDAHIGSFMNKETKTALQAGAPVRIVGALTTLRGKEYLLARQLTIGNRTITLRNQQGLVVPAATGHRGRVRSENQSAVESNGGAR